MKLLEAINNILPYFGEAPVTHVDNKHPTVSVILSTMEQVRANLLLKGWWFNTTVVKLYPSSEGDIKAPDKALSVQGENRLNIEMRDDNIFNLDTGSFLFDGPIEVKMISDLDFGSLPRSAAYWIQTKTATIAYARDYGIEEVYKEMTLREQEAYQQLLTEHLRKKRYSTLDSRYARRYFNALQG